MSIIKLATGIDWPVLLMKAAGYVVSIGLVFGVIAYFAHTQREIGYESGLKDGIADGIKHGKAEVQTAWDAQRETERAEAQIRDAYIRKSQDQARKEADNALSQAHMDRDLAAAAAGRLRKQLTAFRAAHVGAAASAPAGDATGDPIGVLGRLLSESDQMAGEYAEYADRARIAGEACVRSYHALMPRDDTDGGRLDH